MPACVRRFFFSNMDTVALTSIRPDQRRSSDRNEGPKHFIDIENYGNGAMLNMPRDVQPAVEKYTWDTLKKYGYVPYQVLIEYDSLVNALKRKNADSIVFYAVDLAHYIEDACVPLHTTNNYDGQLTGQKGIHALWESAIPELALSHYNLYSKHKAAYIKDKGETIWTAVRRAHALLPEIFEKEKEVAKNFPDNSKYEERMYYGRKTKVYTDAFAKQYAAALTTTINDQLNYSADLVADFWYSAWVDAGKPNLKHLYKFNRTERKGLRKELRDYRKNDLPEDSLLRAKKEQ
ncbi:zinc dependent phospholipase C family protein [Parafilimonas sp.]|uniref:zinc dependent phospholipase C family protein n=1 Tax=Parafilimonas sp. TaxID=1969739 RepID=UPI0039E23113